MSNSTKTKSETKKSPKKKPDAFKSTKAGKLIKVKRVAEVEKMMGLFMDNAYIAREVAVKFGCSERQIRRDMAAIQSRWIEESKDEAPHRRAKVRKFLENVARQALAHQKFIAAVAATHRIMELDGLKIMKLEVESNVNHKIDKMTSGDKRDRMQELMVKAKGLHDADANREPIH